jgi:hypothetical protein
MCSLDLLPVKVSMLYKFMVEHKDHNSIDALYLADRELQIIRDITCRGPVAASCPLQTILYEPCNKFTGSVQGRGHRAVLMAGVGSRSPSAPELIWLSTERPASVYSCSSCTVQWTLLYHRPFLFLDQLGIFIGYKHCLYKYQYCRVFA